MEDFLNAIGKHWFASIMVGILIYGIVEQIRIMFCSVFLAIYYGSKKSETKEDDKA